MNKYVIFTDSCSDLSTELRQKYEIGYCRMGVEVDGKEYPADLDWKAYTPKEFYDWMRQGKSLRTTQVTLPEYIEQFTPWLEKGYDILHLAVSSSLSGSYSLALTLAKPELEEKFPGRKIVVIDTLAAAYTLGIIVLHAALNKEKGMSLEENAKWVEENKLRSNQFATVDTLTYLSKAGRIKGSKAFFGNMFHVKPIFISDRKGNNYTVKTVKGTKNSYNELIAGIKEACLDLENDTVYVGHGDNLEAAQLIKTRLETELGCKHVEIIQIGPIIGTTCGPSILATFCLGKEVTRYEGEDKE